MRLIGISAPGFLNDCGGSVQLRVPVPEERNPQSLVLGCVSQVTNALLLAGSKLNVIKRFAFHATGLTSITIPSSVADVDDFAFTGISVERASL
jgi:hypothetical protein